MILLTARQNLMIENRDPIKYTFNSWGHFVGAIYANFNGLFSSVCIVMRQPSGKGKLEDMKIPREESTFLMKMGQDTAFQGFEDKC